MPPQPDHSRRHWRRQDTIGRSTRTSSARSSSSSIAKSCGPARRRSVEYYSERIDAWLNVSVYPTDEGIALYYHDITDRKGAELLRDASVRQLRQVLETTTDSVASIDRDWNISFLNRRAKELLSPKGELLGKNLWQEFPVAEQNEEIRRYLHRAMDEGIPSEFETFYPDPLNLWLSIQCRPFEDGIVLFFRDVTAERVSRQILLDQQATLAFVQQTARVATWEWISSTAPSNSARAPIPSTDVPSPNSHD